MALASGGHILVTIHGIGQWSLEFLRAQRRNASEHTIHESLATKTTT